MRAFTALVTLIAAVDAAALRMLHPDVETSPAELFGCAPDGACRRLCAQPRAAKGALTARATPRHPALF